MSPKSKSQRSYYLPRTQLEDLLKRVGVVVASHTSTDLICYCPFHNNKDSPAMNISLSSPHKWKCWNGKCGKKGNVLSLLTLKGYSRREAEKLLVKGIVQVDDLVGLVNELLFEDKKHDAAEDWKGIPPERFAEIDAKYGGPAREYLLGRGITDDAITYFQLGYSKAKDMAVVPVFNEYGVLVGTIGREISSKRYKYSTGMDRGALIWNLNNAKAHDAIILNEGSLDSIYVWQAGRENVGAVLGSAISPRQWKKLYKYFSEIICFFDNDEAGQALTSSIVESVTDLSVSYVEYPDRMVEYVDSNGEKKTRPVKDPGELTVEEINLMIENRKDSLQLHFEGAL